MENNMKKFIIALMAFALVITLAGCGGGGGGGSAVDQNVVKYNGYVQSEKFEKDDTCSSIREALKDMEDNFVKDDLTGTQKSNILKANISKSFKNTTNPDSSRDNLISTMKSRFNRYIVNEWGFKVTDYSPKNDPKATEITTKCSIRLDLVLKEGKSGTVTKWNSAVLDRDIVWEYKEEDGVTKWRIKSGFPYDRSKDF